MATSAAKIARIQALINDLSDPDAKVRSKAVSALGRYTTESSVIRDLAMMLTDENAVVRKRAIKALGDNKHGVQAFLPLCQALKDKNASVRKEVVVVLGKLGDQRAIVPIIDAAEDRNASVRAEVAQILRKWNDPRVEGALIELSHDTNETVCINAIASLAMVRGSATIAALQELFFTIHHQSLCDSQTLYIVLFNALEISGGIDLTDQHFRERVLRSITDERCPSYTRVWALSVVGIQEPAVVHKALLSSDVLVRKKAVEIVGSLGNQEVIPLVLPLLKDPSPDVQYAVVDSLRVLQAKNAVGPLVQHLIDLDLEQPELGELFIGTVETVLLLDAQALNTERALAKLTEVARDQEATSKMIRTAISTLYLLKGKAELDVLLLAAQSNEKELSMLAVQMLGKLGDSRAFGPLCHLLEKKISSFWPMEQRKVLVEALARIDRQRAFDFLLEHLHHWYPHTVLKLFIQTLVELNAEQAVQPLRHLLQHVDERVRSAAQSALDKLENSDR